jgi:hypothetical protein
MNLGADGINQQSLNRLNFTKIDSKQESIGAKDISKEIQKMAIDLLNAIQTAANSAVKQSNTLPGAAQAIAGRAIAQKIDLQQLLKILDIFVRIEVMEEHPNLVTQNLTKEDAALLQFAASVLGSRERFRKQVARGIKQLREEGRDPLAGLNSKLENGTAGVSEFLEEMGIYELDETDFSLDLRDPKTTKKIKKAIERAYRED